MIATLACGLLRAGGRIYRPCPQAGMCEGGIFLLYQRLAVTAAACKCSLTRALTLSKRSTTPAVYSDRVCLLSELSGKIKSTVHSGSRPVYTKNGGN